jgi:hypothetical protein
MNPNNQIIEFFENNEIIEFDNNLVIENIEIVENPENNQINEHDVLNLGPLPVLQRHNPPVYLGADAEEVLGQFQEFQGYDTPDDFVMPEPCSRCYWAQCNGTCELDTPFIQAIRATQLSFEEEMDLPPPPALTKNTHVYLMDEEWAVPPPLTRGYTDSHLLDNDEDDDEQEEDNSDEFDMPEGVQYISLTINKDEANEQDEEQDK